MPTRQFHGTDLFFPLLNHHCFHSIPSITSFESFLTVVGFPAVEGYPADVVVPVLPEVLNILDYQTIRLRLSAMGL
jgi:hypothetical protein